MKTPVHNKNQSNETPICIEVEPGFSLELFNPADAHNLFELVEKNRVYLRQWLPWLDYNKRPADSLKFIESSLESYQLGKTLNLKITYYGKIIGVIAHHEINKANRRVALGYWMDAEHSGRGLMSKAVKAFIEYLHTHTNLHRIEICCAVGNTGSARIAEKLGFQLEGIARDAEWLYDRYVDHKIYSLIKEN